ncbi:MAG TPA: hypothetical protein DCS07_00050 [Bdellovibrionales bacterium]|nr:hypothetical protein [Bdellovibrionales bacterium]
MPTSIQNIYVDSSALYVQLRWDYGTVIRPGGSIDYVDDVDIVEPTRTQIIDRTIEARRALGIQHVFFGTNQSYGAPEDDPISARIFGLLDPREENAIRFENSESLLMRLAK